MVLNYSVGRKQLTKLHIGHRFCEIVVISVIITNILHPYITRPTKSGLVMKLLRDIGTSTLFFIAAFLFFRRATLPLSCYSGSDPFLRRFCCSVLPRVKEAYRACVSAPHARGALIFRSIIDYAVRDGDQLKYPYRVRPSSDTRWSL